MASSLVIRIETSQADPKSKEAAMQARLAFNRFPSMLLIVFALVAALLLGGAVGYALKPNTEARAQHSGT